MTVEMALWRMTSSGPRPLSFAPLAQERRLEDMVIGDPTLAGLDLLIVGRQVATTHGGFVDILGVDDEARVHVMELKRDKTPREVVAQVLDYGSWAADLTLDDVTSIWATLSEAFGLALETN